MHWDTQSTICAVATGNTGAARGAIRISGADTVTILAAVMPTLGLESIKRATRLVADFPFGDPFGDLEIDLWLWPNHRSYTGSPSAELHMIGNLVLLNRAVRVLVQNGAKIAEPGEFTLRAFLSGRMDLTQCEAVLGAINARSDRQFEVALNQLAGGLSHPLRSVRATLIDLLADIEAGLDFVDEDIEFVTMEVILKRLKEAESTIEQMLLQMSNRQGNESSFDVVLTGRPNAGKSSLLNAITGSNTAIVNQMPGTTRDYLRVPLQRDGRSISIVDTAGMEWNSNKFGDEQDATSAEIGTHIDGLAEQMTLQQREAASLVLYCIDSTLEAIAMKAEIDSFVSQYASHSQTWLIWTKSEGGSGVDIASQSLESLDSYHTFRTSAKDGKGVVELVQALFDWFDAEAQEVATAVSSTASRCLSSLEDAISALRNSREAAQLNANELVAGELRLALEAIGKVAGEVYNDDILDALFSRFCIGK